MTKIDTLFMTKTAENPYPLGPQIPIAHIREYLPQASGKFKAPAGTSTKIWHITMDIINRIPHVAKQPQLLPFLQNRFPATIQLDSTQFISLTVEACVLSRQ